MADTFTEDQQKKHREVFIGDCRQKAWNASCHADWIAQGLDHVAADMTKLQEEDAKLDEQIKTLEAAVDSHTVDNRTKRKALQERRNSLSKTTTALAASHQEGQRALGSLYQSIEGSLALAKHAETWECKEASSEQNLADVLHPEAASRDEASEIEEASLQ